MMIFLMIFVSILFIMILSIILSYKKILLFIWKKTIKERIVKIIIHHDTNFYKMYYKLIPKNKLFTLNKLKYFYDNKYLIKSDIAIDTDTNNITIDNQSYNFNKLMSISNKNNKNFPEIHYFYNNPMPINFNKHYSDQDKTIADKDNLDTVNLTSHEFTKLYENDLFIKLLSISDEKRLLMFVIFMNIIIVIMTVIMAIKVYDVIQ